MRLTCGKHLPDRQVSRFVNRLRLSAGGIVEHAEMIDALWYDDPAGGPICARYYLRIICGALRIEGFPIKTYYGRGYGWDTSVPRLPAA